MNIIWLKAAAIRAVKTFAQAMVAQIGAGSVGITTFDWATALSVSAMAAALSIFTSLAGLPEVDRIEQLQSTFNGDGIGSYMEEEVYEDPDNTAQE